MKVTFTIIILALVFINVNAQAPDWAWAKRAGGTGSEGGNSTTTDFVGNVYVTGSFTSDSINFGTTTLTNAGGWDIYIVKYDASGNVIWVKGVGNIGDDWANSITTDAFGNVYITGYYASDSITFETTTLTNVNAGSKDIFIAKYDALGNLTWAKNAGSTADDYGNSIVTDASGNVFVTGYYSSSITFGSISLTHTGNKDIFIVKYDTVGNLIWAKRAGGNGPDEGYSAATDDDGNVYVTGSFFASSITFGAFTILNAGIGNDMFIVKFDSIGNVIWANGFGGNGVENGQSITTDEFGNVYVTGYTSSPTITSGTITLINPDSLGLSNYLFILKYNTQGNLNWAKSAGGTGNDFGYCINTDAAGGIYVVGYYSSPFISFGAITLTNAGGAGNFNIFIVKFDAFGNALWAKSEGYAGVNSGKSVTTDLLGNVYMTGSFQSAFIDFGVNNLTNAGSYDMYIAKLSVNSVGIEKNSDDNGITIYPNPNNGICTIKSTDLKLQNCSLYNLLGECVFTQKSNLTNQINIDISAQAKGIYFLEITDEKDNVMSKKIILE